jgi:MFS family permease
VPEVSSPARRVRIRMDLRPLRHSRDFRWVFTSGLVTYLGSMVTMVALPFQVAQLTNSFVAVGLIGLAELVPIILFGLWGGAMADAVDRRRVVVLTEFASLALSVVLLVNALLPEPHLWVIYVVAMVFAAVDGLQRPSLEAIIPRVVAHDELAAAGALNSLRWQVGSIAGPALGGLLIAGLGVWSAYAFDAASFLISGIALWRLRTIPPSESAEPASLRRIGESMRYAWSRKDLLGTYAVDLMAMVFAFPYALFPFLADDLGAPWVLGFLYAAGAVGGLLATLTSGWTSHVHHHGRAVLVAAICWGLAIAGVGLSDSVPIVLLMLGLAGAADMISALFRMLIWNQTIPDDLRGRMAGVELLSYSIGPTLGQVRSTGVAALTSLRTSLVSGGLLCAAGGVLLAFALPTLWHFDDRTDPNATRERSVRAARAAADAPGE